MTTFYDEKLGVHAYPTRCDKHNLKPYVYCEMCYIHSTLGNIVEENRKKISAMVSNAYLSITVLNDCYSILEKKIIELQKLSVK